MYINMKLGIHMHCSIRVWIIKNYSRIQPITYTTT